MDISKMNFSKSHFRLLSLNSTLKKGQNFAKTDDEVRRKQMLKKWTKWDLHTPLSWPGNCC